MDLHSRLRQLKIPIDVVSLHQSRIKKWIRDGRTSTFKINDTCRLDNFGVISLNAFSNSHSTTPKYSLSIAAFVPAAGASSRYYQAFESLNLALDLGQPESVRQSLDELFKLDVMVWPTFAKVKEILSAWHSGAQINESDIKTFRELISLPKAVQPSSVANLTFLGAKIQEHSAMAEVSQQIFVAPQHATQLFDSEIADRHSSKPSHVLIQDAEMSTIRFTTEGEPFVDQNDNVSSVPAGHGALARLFPLAKELTNCRALFIRNVDNCTGTSQPVLNATSKFFSGCSFLFEQVDLIRSHLSAGSIAEACATARLLMNTFGIECDSKQSLANQSFSDLVNCQLLVFHTPPQLLSDMIQGLGEIQALAQIYARPINVLGQVPNVNKDVGGTPCFVQTKNQTVKLILEVPHASPDDREKFLANPIKATHFNPVFAVSEIPTRNDYYDGLSNDFWVISEKKFAGQKVLYHETVLYELIGNSLSSNCVFVEIPRELFKPHKSVQDGINSAR